MSLPASLMQTTAPATKRIYRAHGIAGMPDALQRPGLPCQAVFSPSHAPARLSPRKAGGRGGGVTARWMVGLRFADSARGGGMRGAAPKRVAVGRSLAHSGPGIGAGLRATAAILDGRAYRATAIGGYYLPPSSNIGDIRNE